MWFRENVFLLTFDLIEQSFLFYCYVTQPTKQTIDRKYDYLKLYHDITSYALSLYAYSSYQVMKRNKITTRINWPLSKYPTVSHLYTPRGF